MQSAKCFLFDHIFFYFLFFNWNKNVQFTQSIEIILVFQHSSKLKVLNSTCDCRSDLLMHFRPFGAHVLHILEWVEAVHWQELDAFLFFFANNKSSCSSTRLCYFIEICSSLTNNELLKAGAEMCFFSGFFLWIMDYQF